MSSVLKGGESRKLYKYSLKNSFGKSNNSLTNLSFVGNKYF